MSNSSENNIESEIIPRSAWKAIEAKSFQTIEHSVPKILLLETGTNEYLEEEDCYKCMRKMQKTYLDKGFDDIPWSFVITNHGAVFEGRGWYYKPFKTDLTNPIHREYDGLSFHFAFMGKFKEYLPLENAVKSLNELLNYAVKNGYLKDDYEAETFLMPPRPILRN